LSSSLASRLASPLRQFGWKEGFLYLLGKGLARLSAGRIQLIRYHFVAQPVPVTPQDRPLPQSARTSIDFIKPADALVAQFPRPQAVIARRFANGDRCIVSRTDERFAGYIWFARGHYDEDTVRCRYTLSNPSQSVWDYDVFVHPDFRMGRTFARLWSTANCHLAEEGVRWSYSRIATANPQSLDSHRRLGIEALFSASFLKVGTLQLMIASTAPYVHLSLSATSIPELRLLPPQRAGDT
jgi:hypothetical protein